MGQLLLTSNPTHTYANTGNYTVTLMIVMLQVAEILGSAHKQCKVKSEHRWRHFTPSATSGCSTIVNEASTINLLILSMQTLFEFWWNGTTSNVLLNPTNVFVDSGAFVVTLIITNANGCKDTATHNICVINTNSKRIH